jgi:sortase (surface protein transpeptidase)
MVKKYNVSKPEKYIKDGVEKTYWANVGTMTEFEKQDGSVSRILEIPAIGLKANIFPVTDRAESKPAPKKSEPETGVDPIEYPTENINPEDIPF